MEEQLVKEIVESFTSIGCLFDNPGLFMRSLFEALKPREREISALFKDRIDVFTEMFETELKKAHLPECRTPEEDIKLSFVVGGAARVFLNTGYDHATISKALEEILKGMQKN
jgi:hypothetical protein